MQRNGLPFVVGPPRLGRFRPFRCTDCATHPPWLLYHLRFPSACLSPGPIAALPERCGDPTTRPESWFAFGSHSIPHTPLRCDECDECDPIRQKRHPCQATPNPNLYPGQQGDRTSKPGVHRRLSYFSLQFHCTPACNEMACPLLLIYRDLGVSDRFFAGSSQAGGFPYGQRGRFRTSLRRKRRPGLRLRLRLVSELSAARTVSEMVPLCTDCTTPLLWSLHPLLFP